MNNTDDIEPQLISQVENHDEIEPTEEELAALEHISDQIPLTAWLIVVCEFCERFAYIGLTGPFQNYIQFPVPGPNDKQPGALGLGQRTATLIALCFQFLCYFTPIGGAILADQFWGKYKTIVLACVIYLLGLCILVLTSIPFSIRTGIAFPGLITALVILALATGGLKSNVSPLMAQQYTRTKPIVKEIGGKKKIIDPKVTLQSMFTWFYWSINMGAFSCIISTNIEKYYSFWLAYLVPMTVFIGCIGVLFIGRQRYVCTPPKGSLIIRAFRIIMRAIGMRWKLGKQQHCQHILDYAKEYLLPISNGENETITESDQNLFIDELKQAWNACRVFAFYPFFWICLIQTNSNLISQAAQMNVGPLPNDVLQNTEAIMVLILVPIFDKLIYPTLRKYNINFTMLGRITCGFFFASFAIGWTAFVQHMIYSTGPNYDYTIIPCETCQKFNNITVAWQMPSYILMAFADIFGAITGLEYAFTHAPSSMKSIIISLFLFTTGIGSALNFILVPFIIDPKLLWVYTSISITAFVAGVGFIICFRNDKGIVKNNFNEKIN